MKDGMGNAGFHFSHRYLLTDRFMFFFYFVEIKYHLSLFYYCV